MMLIIGILNAINYADQIDCPYVVLTNWPSNSKLIH